MPPKTKRVPTTASTEAQEPKPKRQQKARAPAQKNVKTAKPARAKPLTTKAAPAAPPPPSLIPQARQKKGRLNLSTPNPTFVTVYAGTMPNTQAFVLHKSAISHYSPIFAEMLASTLPSNPTLVDNATTSPQAMDTSQPSKALVADPGSLSSSNSRAGLSVPIAISTTQITMNSIHLPTVSASVFGLFANWIYFQELPSPSTEDELPDLLELAELWIFGATYLIPSLQNTAILPLIYLLAHYELISGDPGGLQDFRKSKLKEFCDLAYAESAGVRESGEQNEDWKRQLKQLAVDSALRYIAKGIAIADWVPSFPKGMVVDFTSEMVKCVEGLPKVTKGVIGSREKSYLVGVSEEKGVGSGPQSGQEAEQAKDKNASTEGDNMMMDREGEGAEARNINERSSDNRVDTGKRDSSVKEAGNINNLQTRTCWMQITEEKEFQMQQAAKA